MGILSKLLTAGQGHQIKKYGDETQRINALEPRYHDMTDEELIAEHKVLLKKGRSGSTGKDFRERSFAFFREWTLRILGKRAYDVQLMAAMALDDGHVAEASTGSGKTIMSHFATYFNVLKGLQVHVVSVNEYLTKRDGDETRLLFEPLGLTVGNIYNQQPDDDKHRAYSCDVVYGTPSEFGFDYLRDNMVRKLEDKKQQAGHQFAIIDEADSVLIDESRTPLIISGPKPMDNNTFRRFADIVRTFTENVDYAITDESKKIIVPTEEGIRKAEQTLGVENMYADPSNMYPNYLNNALRAAYLYKRDKDYIVSDGEVKIVDEFTGRVMAGRRWSDGLHQAIEAKEGVKIRAENQTIATITLQNYFRLYDKLSGMTGTAMTEDAEFRDTYGMGVIQIPDNKPCQRQDKTDLLYISEQAKFNAIADEVEARHAKGQPVLIGTISIEKSERLSRVLAKRGLKHNVLNAKHHAKEASIIAQAGRFGAITIATNMAGRGTDIQLGGNVDDLTRDLLKKRYELIGEDGEPIPYTQAQIAECREDARAIHDVDHDRVVAAGGLYVLGSERHDSRRIDNQLRGRSGRQGDPGESRFFLSFDDDLLRLFGDEKMQRNKQILIKAGIDPAVPIESKLFTRSVETAQRNVEGINAEARKNVLKYDDVLNKQRQAIYAERDAILAGKDMDDKVAGIIEDTVTDGVAQFCDPDEGPSEWNWDGIAAWYTDLTGREPSEAASPRIAIDEGDLIDDLIDDIEGIYEAKKKAYGKSLMNKYERNAMLLAIDVHWTQHLGDMDYLKTGIGLRGYSQRDPLTEYKQEAYDMFGALVDSMYTGFLKQILHYEKATPSSIAARGARAVAHAVKHAGISGNHVAINGAGDGKGKRVQKTVVAAPGNQSQTAAGDAHPADRTAVDSMSGDAKIGKHARVPVDEEDNANSLFGGVAMVVDDTTGEVNTSSFTFSRPHSPTGDVVRAVEKAKSAGVDVDDVVNPK